VQPFSQENVESTCSFTFNGNPVRVEGALVAVGLGTGAWCVPGPCLGEAEIVVFVFNPSNPNQVVECADFANLGGVCRNQGSLTRLRVGTELVCQAALINLSSSAREAAGIYRCSSGTTSI
jgi:hypothetical protein